MNHGEFLRKVACVSHSQRSLERYYTYNTSYAGLVRNSAPGDHCTRYQFTVVPGTNLFVGLIHEATTRSEGACSPRSAFCACSTRDRPCLNCGRLEPLECECPCQCPLGVVAGPAVGASASPLDVFPACVALSVSLRFLSF